MKPLRTSLRPRAQCNEVGRWASHSTVAHAPSGTQYRDEMTFVGADLVFAHLLDLRGWAITRIAPTDGSRASAAAVGLLLVCIS